MGYEDIRARMPPFIQVKKHDPPVYKPLYKASTLSERCRHFRESAGAISWGRREGSGKIKSFIESIVKPVGNSTAGSRDLTKDEVNELRLENCGTKPKRARAGTTQEAKDKYTAKTLKRARVTESRQEADEKADDAPGLEAEDGEMEIYEDQSQYEADDKLDETQEQEARDEEMELPEGQNQDEAQSNRGWDLNYLLDYDALYSNDQEDQFVENPLAAEEDTPTQEDEST